MKDETPVAYDHTAIEKKWHDTWQQNNTYATEDSREKQKCYVLDMFPYPSGEGLHVGHPRGYVATDVYSRKKRMEGFDVLHPMGWDAFGLPAENYAIKNKVHPRVAVEKNVARYKEQLSLIGFDYDWSREINTTDPSFYKWTQWMFLKMYERGLAYESNEPVNWCPNDKTVLANEDVEPDGTCERCGAKVETRALRQWVPKITDYADRILADLDKLPKWPEGVKQAQRNWIGKREGSEIHFNLEFTTHPELNKNRDAEGNPARLAVFTTRADTLFGVTYIVLAPEHPWVTRALDASHAGVIDNTEEVRTYVESVKDKTEIDRTNAKKEKTGVEIKGVNAINPANGESVPVWIADYVLAGYGTGAVMAVPAHDERDFAFAKKYDLPIKCVIDPVITVFKQSPVSIEDIFSDERNKYLNGEIFYTEKGNLINSSEKFNNIYSEEAKIKITESVGGKMVSTYKIKDWVFSRQRYWGEPIPMIHCKTCGVVPVPEKELPVLLPEVESYEPTGTGESPLAAIDEWVNTTCPTCGGAATRETNTMPQWAGSSWYYLRFIDPHNATAFIDPAKEKQWMPVDVYVGGDHATRHLIYARFWHKVLFDLGLVSTEEPFPRLEFLGFILAEDGRKMSKRWKNVVNPDDVVQQFGADAFRLYEMFIAPFEGTVPWNTNGLVGTYRFLEKVWRMSTCCSAEKTDASIIRALHKTIQKVTDDIETFKFNTAVSSLMILVNEIEKKGKVHTDEYKILLQLLAPFAPHITEELWHEFGEKESIHHSKWPIFDPLLIVDETVTIGVQVNGKVRAELTVARAASTEELEMLALAHTRIQEYLAGRAPKQVIVVPGRVINIVL